MTKCTLTPGDVTTVDKAKLFIEALERQIQHKALFTDGINNQRKNPLELIASIAEELGELASDYIRQREYGVITECIDVAHSALLLAITLDKDGEVLRRIYHD